MNDALTEAFYCDFNHPMIRDLATQLLLVIYPKMLPGELISYRGKSTELPGTSFYKK